MSKQWKLTSALLTLWNQENASIFKRDADILENLKTIINIVDKARSANPHRIPSYRG